MKQVSAAFAVLFLMFVLACPTWGADIFVRTGDARGDGSRDWPFRDPYLALDSANPGDVVHIAKGTYHGRLDSGNWFVAAPRLTILGGYSDDFSSRDPWKNRTVLCAYRGYTGPREEHLLLGKIDHTGLVVDGLLLDGSSGNQYGTGTYGDLKASATRGELALFDSPDVVIRNCVFLNGANGAAKLSGEGSRFENNIVANQVGTFLLRLDPAPGTAHRPMVAKGNTLLFSWSVNAPAKGGEQGVGIGVTGPAQIIDNVITGCDNHGVAVLAPADQVSLQGNVFWMNGKSNVCVWIQSGATTVDDASMDDLGDVGLKKSDNNIVKDPQLAALDAGWIDAHSGWVHNHYPKASREKLAALRKSVGLPEEVGSSPEPANVFAPAYPIDQAALIASGMADKGAHPIALQVSLRPSNPAGPPPSYAPATWKAFSSGDKKLDGKRIELIVPTGNERSSYPFDSIKESDFVGVELLAPTEQIGGVEEWRGGDVCAAPFPLPAHQTGRADFPHPASGPR